jgi:hypothetical protein
MKAIKTILRHLNLFDRSRDIERDIEEELRFHLEMRARDNIEAGMTAAEAEVEALRRFGDYDNVKATCREITKERLEGPMTSKSIKGIIWVMLGCGLALHITSDIDTLSKTGQALSLIAILWRLLISLKEGMTGAMDSKAIKVIIWTMLGCGLTLEITGGIRTVMNVGNMLIYIAILWRLLLYLRKSEPDQQRIKAAQQTMLNIPGVDFNTDIDANDGGLIERPFRLVPTYDQRGRTPVERLISEDK